MLSKLNLLFVVVVAVGCTAGPADPWGEKPGPKVLAFFPPIHSLASSVAGDHAQVQSLLTNTGPHDYEPTSRDARRLKRADLFVINGLGLDDMMASRLAQTCGNPKLKLVELGESIDRSTLRKGGCNCGNKNHDHSNDFDPHVWLGIPEATAMTKKLAAQLSAADPAHAAEYTANADALAKRLADFQAKSVAELKAKTERPRVISFHDSLHYFGRSFGVEIVDSIEAPGAEASAKRLGDLVQKCKDENVRIIAVEPQYSTNNAAKTLLNELRNRGIDAVFVELDPLETAHPGDLGPGFYEKKMRQNIDNLLKALK